MKIKILGTPFNGLKLDSEIENSPDGLQNAELVLNLALFAIAFIGDSQFIHFVSKSTRIDTE